MFVEYVRGELGEWGPSACGAGCAGLRSISGSKGRRICLGEEGAVVGRRCGRLVVCAQLATSFMWAIAQRCCTACPRNCRRGRIGREPGAKTSPERVVDKGTRRHEQGRVRYQKFGWGSLDGGVRRLICICQSTADIIRRNTGR
jgi:hypothetical protein